MKLEDAIKKIFDEARFPRKVGELEGKSTREKRHDRMEKEKKRKDYPKPGKQKSGFAEPVKEAQLEEAQSSDPVVDETAGAIIHALVASLEDDDILANNAFEMMMGSAPNEDRLSQVRLEDVESTSELVVQAVFRDPHLHAKLKQIAMDMIESAAAAVRS